MSIQIAEALKSGFRRSASRNGLVLALGYLVVTAVYGVGYFGLFLAFVSELPTATTTGSMPSLDIPISVAAALFLVGFLLMTYFNVVAFRTFVDGARSSFPDGAFSRHVPYAVINMVLGGIVAGIAVVALMMVPVMAGELVGSDAVGLLGALIGFVVAFFVSISLAFMPMYIAVNDDSFVAAIRHSWKLSSGNRLSLFLLFLLLAVLIFVMFIPLVIAAAVLSVVGGPFVFALVYVVGIALFTIFQMAVISTVFEQLGGRTTSGQGGAATGAPTSPA